MEFLKVGGKEYKHLSHDFKVKGRLYRLLDAEAGKVEISTLAKSDDFSARGLIEVNTKTKQHFKGYLHPRAGLVVAICWFKAEIASEVINWYYRYLSGDASLIHDVADRVDLVHGTKSLLTRTVIDKEENDAVLADLHAKAAQHQSDIVKLQAKLEQAVAKDEKSMLEMNELQNRLKASIDELNGKLAKLGLVSDFQNRRLTTEIRKRKRLCGVIRQNDEQNESMFIANLMQRTQEDAVEGPGEQPSCNSMPARFIALTGVNEATNGKDHKIVHALIKETIAAVGENIMKFHRVNGMSQARILFFVSSIIGEQAQDNGNNPLTSNVFIVNLICGNLKRIYGLKHATHMTLGAVYRLVRSANRWFQDHHLSSEFQLIQENDLVVLLSYDVRSRPKLAKYDPTDIRLHFNKVAGMAGVNAN